MTEHRHVKQVTTQLAKEGQETETHGGIILNAAGMEIRGATENLNLTVDNPAPALDSAKDPKNALSSALHGAIEEHHSAEQC